MRWTVPVPIPSDLASFKIPTPFASCFRTFRSMRDVYLRSAEIHALGLGALETCFYSSSDQAPLKLSKGAGQLENQLAQRGRRVDGLLVEV